MAKQRTESMHLTSSAIKPGGQIPRRFTCDAENLSPPLAWSGAPAEARSFAIVCRDPDAPSGDFYHWAAFDIPANVSRLTESRASGNAPLRDAVNDFGNRGYGGPCPPRGHGAHRYHFKLYAIDVERLELPPTARCRDVEHAAGAHALATAELIGTYSRS